MTSGNIGCICLILLKTGVIGKRKTMANHTATKKSIRKTKTVTAKNRSRKSRIKNFITKVEAAVVGGNKAQAQEAFKAAQPEIMKGVSKGVIKLSTASRKVSRLSAKVKAMA